MRTITTKLRSILIVIVALIGPAIAAEDESISSVGHCSTSLGSVVETANGLKAQGGTAVVSCPLGKRVGTDQSSAVYVRLSRAEGGGSAPFCYLISTPPYGTNTSITYGYAESYSGAQSINVPMPSLYLTGYLDLYCLLNNNDILYGVRHAQVD